MVKATELTAALKTLNLYHDDAEIKNIVSEIDYYGNGMINYSEFIAATLSFDEQVLGEHLWMLFKKFDVDNTDQITVENLEEAFHRQGRVKIGREELLEIIQKHDIDHSGKIDFSEFK